MALNGQSARNFMRARAAFSFGWWRLESTPHRLIWTLFAGVMGFFVGGSFLAALQTPLPTNGAARQTTQTDTSEPILSRPVVVSPQISAQARPRNKQHKRAPDRWRRAQ